jgi:site-specific DNA-methyltransferase (adenine-specific)
LLNMGQVGLIKGDCLEAMPFIPDKSVDMILCDLPYGTTACKWDTIIPFETLWAQYKRIIKPNGAIVLTASQPFTSALVMSNVKWFKYCWYWIKEAGTGFLNAKKYPLKNCEEVCVFCDGYHMYNPQMGEGKPYTCKKGGSTDNYNKDAKTTQLLGNEIVTVNKGERYPLTTLSFKRDKEKLHPTQKPVALFEYLIKTYTNEGDLVLDNCAGSGTTGVACLNTGRQCILIEKEPEYWPIIEGRIGI